MYQPWSHKRKVAQDSSSIVLLRCMPIFFSREGFSRSFPSPTMKSNFVYLRLNRSLFVGHFYFLFFSEGKSQLPGLELTSQRAWRSRGYQLSNRGNRLLRGNIYEYYALTAACSMLYNISYTYKIKSKIQLAIRLVTQNRVQQTTSGICCWERWSWVGDNNPSRSRLLSIWSKGSLMNRFAIGRCHRL